MRAPDSPTPEDTTDTTPEGETGMAAPEARSVRQRVRIQTALPPPQPARNLAGNGAGTASASAAVAAPSGHAGAARTIAREAIFDVRDMSVSYAGTCAIAGATLQIQRNLITAVIGPSGCGKTTFLRSLNRMNDSVPGFELTGKVLGRMNGEVELPAREGALELSDPARLVLAGETPVPARHDRDDLAAARLADFQPVGHSLGLCKRQGARTGSDPHQRPGRRGRR